MRKSILALSRAVAVVGPVVLASVALAAPPAPLPEDPIPAVEKLPADYPKSWVLVSDLYFPSVLDGRVVVVDTMSPERPLKGMVRAAQFANMLFSPAKREIYTAETFYSRLTRGERTDAITIWNTATLQPKGEIVLPGGKRQQGVTYSGTFQFTNDERWALVANFTPAQSITVVDLDARSVLNEIDLPGCSHIYPTGARGFTSFCADGSLISVQLDEKGAVVASKTVENVQNIDSQAQFQMPAMVGRTAWFVTYGGQLKGYDLSGPVARPVSAKLSVGTAEGGQPEWRPGGWQVIAADPRGLLYVLMSPYGREGSHKDGGTEVWVIDPASGKRTNRIVLQAHSASIALTSEAAPRLVVTRADMGIDIYHAGTGAFIHSLGHAVAQNPIVYTPVP
jgi:methylamine dehydrogenase heavy chain